MRRVIVYGFIIFIFGCSKKHDALYGLVTVSGKVTDIVSNEPIANAVVELMNVQRKYNIGGYNNVRTGTALTDTTDASGNYSFSINATGQYQFDLLANPMDPLHVNSDLTTGTYTIQKVGNFSIDMQCLRSAYAKITLTNVSPIDTPYFISIAGITLNNFYKDTLVYLKLVGSPDIPNTIIFNTSNQASETYQKTVGPWDTIPMQLNY
jgi:hypothetical protein